MIIIIIFIIIIIIINIIIIIIIINNIVLVIIIITTMMFIIIIIRRITFPRKTLVEVYAKVLPNVFEKETNWMDIEVIGINKMTFNRFLGLLVHRYNALVPLNH